MPRVCTICAHRERAAIDEALATRTGSLRSVAAQFGVSLTSLRRHAETHLPAQLVRAAEAQEVAHGGSLLAQVHHLHARALALLATAESANDRTGAIQAIREARGCIELLAKMEGQLREREAATVNVLVAPDWVRLRGVILAALRDDPEAAQRVAAALINAEGG